MARWNFGRSASVEPPRYALTAAAQAVKLGRQKITPTYESWQREVWGYYDELGEFRYAVDWLSQMVSRVRLRAGLIQPGQDEPELVDKGPAADLIDQLGGGTVGGRAQLMHDFALQLSVPGECWLTGENRGGVQEWLVRSSDEIRGRGQIEVVDIENSTNTKIEWRPLSTDALVVRVWRPHARMHHVADAPGRTARGVMRELELVNRHITGEYLSRLASAGVFIMPDEVTFPVRAEFEDADDPFVLEWIETAKEAIQSPGTAAAVIPIPMRVPADMVEKFQHIDFSMKADEKILEKRDSAIRRLATQLDLPAEVLLGMGDVNHWSAWQLEEAGIKTHISPLVEQITHSLTVGYLIPRLKAAGETDLAKWVVWYDASEITQRPDRSANAVLVYDKLELNGEALRRETGFDEADMPDQTELRDMVMKKMAVDPRVVSVPAMVAAVLAELTGRGLDVEVNAPAVTGGPSGPPPPGTEPAPIDQTGPPTTKDAPPPPPGASAMARDLRRLVDRAEGLAKEARAGRPHWLERRRDGMTIRHPESCGSLPVTCPYDELLLNLHIVPGRTGVYECWLENNETRLVVGRMRQQMTGATYVDAVPALATMNGVNGAHSRP